MSINESFWRYDRNLVLRGLLWLNWGYHWQYGRILIAKNGASQTFLGTDLVVSGIGYSTGMFLTILIDPTYYDYYHAFDFNRELKEWQGFLKYTAKP